MQKEKKRSHLATYFGEEISQKALDFRDDIFKIIMLKEEPLEIRVVIYDKEMVYHIIIDENKQLIYHECPSIQTNQTFHDKLCLHLIKLTLTIEPKLGTKVLHMIDEYGISLNHPYLEEKHKNFFYLAQNLKRSGLILEALDTSLKAGKYLNDSPTFGECLNTILEHNNFLNFFYYLAQLSENLPQHFSENYFELLLKGLSKCKDHIKDWKFIVLIKIITSIEKILENQELYPKLMDNFLITQLSSLKSNIEFNEKYFFYYFLNKYFNEFKQRRSGLIRSLNYKNYKIFKNYLLEFIFRSLEEFFPIEYIELIDKHLEIFGITHKFLAKRFEKYYQKISRINKKFLVRKLGFLKLLIKKSKTYRSKIEFNRINSLITFEYESNNLNNDFLYDYLFAHLGFFGEKYNLIKPRDIGLHFILFKQLFKIEWEKNALIAYFHQKYWSKSIENEITLNKGKPLLRYGVEYTHDVGLDFLNIEEIILVEWELAKNLNYGSQVVAHDTHKIIPNFNNPLFFDLKPFDLCFYEKKPVEIIDGKYKVINVITKCSFKDAIISLSKGIKFIESSYPLSLVQKVLDKEIEPFEAIEILDQSPKKKYVPHFYKFIYEFKQFLFRTVLKKDEYLFSNDRKFIIENFDIILEFLNLQDIISGIHLPHYLIVNLFEMDQMNKNRLRKKILNLYHEYIKEILEKKKVGSTYVFDLEKMKYTPFSKYYSEILEIRKEEFEQADIYKHTNDKTTYDISKIARTYYGKKILETLNLQGKFTLDQVEFEKFRKISTNLGLNINLIDKI